MSLMPEERMALEATLAEWSRPFGFVAPTSDVTELVYAAGIARERARCAKVCRDEAARWVGDHARQAALNCALKIEAPAAGGQPKE